MLATTVSGKVVEESTCHKGSSTLQRALCERSAIKPWSQARCIGNTHWFQMSTIDPISLIWEFIPLQRRPTVFRTLKCLAVKWVMKCNAYCARSLHLFQRVDNIASRLSTKATYSISGSKFLRLTIEKSDLSITLTSDGRLRIVICPKVEESLTVGIPTMCRFPPSHNCGLPRKVEN